MIDPGGILLCIDTAYRCPFSREESLKLCAGGDVANAECAIKAYAGPYSREEALKLCTTQPLLILKSLRLIEQSSEIQQKLKLIQK